MIALQLTLAALAAGAVAGGVLALLAADPSLATSGGAALDEVQVGGRWGAGVRLGG